MQKENILLHVQTGNDVIFTVDITQILTRGVQKWCNLWRGVFLALKFYLQIEPQLSLFCCLLWWPNCFFSTTYYPFRSLSTLTKFHCVTFQGMKDRAQMWNPYVMQTHLPPCLSHRLLWVISSGALRLIPPLFSHHLLSHIVFCCDYSLWCLLSPAPCWWSVNHFLPLFCSWFPRRRWSPHHGRARLTCCSGNVPCDVASGQIPPHHLALTVQSVHLWIPLSSSTKENV